MKNMVDDEIFPNLNSLGNSYTYFITGEVVSSSDKGWDNFLNHCMNTCKSIGLLSKDYIDNPELCSEIDGVKYPNWNGLKDYFRNLAKMGADGVDLALSLEYLNALTYDFGVLENRDGGMYRPLVNFMRGELDEVKLDMIFSAYLHSNKKDD